MEIMEKKLTLKVCGTSEQKKNCEGDSRDERSNKDLKS